MSKEAHVSVSEAARTLDRSTEQVRRYLREGRLSGTRIGGQWFIDRGALTAFEQNLREQRSFLQQLPPAAELDPLGAVIAIGGGGGSDITKGTAAYREAFRWRRNG
jgi:excisionase family DNA binding protein